MSRPGPAAKRPSGWEGLCPVGFARPYSSREKRSPPRDPRGAVRETPPSNANKRRCTPTSVPFGSPSARGYARGGCVCALCRPSAIVSATRGEAGLPPRFGGGAGRGESEAVSSNVAWRTSQETASASRDRFAHCPNGRLRRWPSASRYFGLAFGEVSLARPLATASRLGLRPRATRRLRRGRISLGAFPLALAAQSSVNQRGVSPRPPTPTLASSSS